MASCIVGLRMSLLLVYPCIFFFFLSIFFVKDISTTVKHRKFIFCIQVDNDKLYCGIENEPSPVYTPGQSPGRAIVLPPASALAAASALAKC